MADGKSGAVDLAKWVVSTHNLAALAFSLLVLFFYDPQGEDAPTMLRGAVIISFVVSQILTRGGAWLLRRGRREAGDSAADPPAGGPQA